MINRSRIAVLAGLLAVGALAAGCTGSSGNGATSSAPSTPGTTVTRTDTGPAPSSSTGSSTTRQQAPQKLTDVRVADATFVGDQAWLLGTAECLDGSGGRCSALEHSTDGGRTWTSLRGPVVHVDGSGTSCAAPCVSGIRFASDQVGYLFGRTAFFTTTDAGATWHRQGGGADAVEAAGGSVIRVIDQGDCPPGCTYSVQLADVGSTAWHSVALPGQGNLGAGVSFARAGRDAYLLSLANPAGGAAHANSVLWTTADGGITWTRRGEPCPQSGGEWDSTRVSAAPDGSAVAVCRRREQQGGNRIVRLTAAGRVSAASATALGAAEVTALGAASPSVILVSSDQTYRSTDGGSRFARVQGPQLLRWIGFGTTSVGHAISTDGATLWNTTDGGARWTSAKLD